MLSPATKDETLFIGGFPPQTKEKDLKEYFSSYSSLVSISIVKNCFEKSRGFGYVTFSNPEDVKAVINGIHKLNGKMFSVKKLMNKDDVAKQKSDQIKRKVFLGGLNKKTNEVTLEQYFSKFGEIEDILINRDIANNSSKGCAFLLFKKAEVAKELIQSKQVHIIDGKYVEVKKCYEKSKSKALKEEKKLKAQQGENLLFMNMLQSSAGMNMGHMMNQFMGNFMGGFSGMNQQMVNSITSDLMQNQGFQDYMNQSHRNMMKTFESMNSNSLITPFFSPQNCPVYNGRDNNFVGKVNDYQPTKTKNMEKSTKCPFNFGSSTNNKNLSNNNIHQKTYFGFSGCPFGKKQKDNETLTTSQMNQYDQYLSHRELIVSNNPHQTSGYPSTGFDRCPLAQLLHVNKQCEYENHSHESTKFQFEKAVKNRTCTKSFIEMISTSRKYKLLHKEANLKFKKGKKGSKDPRLSRCPFARKTYISAL